MQKHQKWRPGLPWEKGRNMRITDLLKPEGILIGGAPSTKDEAIDQLVELMEQEGNVRDKAAYAAAVREREAEFSTGLGDGIAIERRRPNPSDLFPRRNPKRR